MEMQAPILVLGAGAMGGAMARSWHEAGYDVQLVVRNPARRAEYEALGLLCFTALADAPREAGTLVLATKPQQFAPLEDEIRRWCRADTLLLSIMAGIPLARLQAVAPRALRVMPNLAAAIGESMSLACAPELDPAAREHADALLQAVGEVAWLDREDELHLASALAGSGPGFVFAIMDALEHAAVALGMDGGLAAELTRQTMLGAALLASVSDDTAAALAKQVASPGGMTQKGLDVLAAHELKTLMRDVLAAAAARSRELAAA